MLNRYEMKIDFEILHKKETKKNHKTVYIVSKEIALD
jgi:hypothetical protein